MDDAILERLFFDDVLGALSPDASALLAAHIHTLPGGSERLAAWRRLTETARAAMPTASSETLPPFPVSRMVSNPWRIGRIGLSVAAALFLGLGIGLLFPHQPTRSPQVAITPQPIMAEVPSPIGVHDFWSSQRLFASALGEKHESSAAWHWISPINQPETEGIK